jgi:DNA repair ATPase RecN
MWERLRVHHYQSLRQVELGLGRLTVIVGPSSSGKSALIRALRMLICNARGTSYISHGAKAASVSLHFEDTIATIERSENHGAYRLNVGGEELVFTKLAGAVPEAVTAALGIPADDEGSSLNVAGQFDRPYLLTQSGGTVARVLGALTNVSIIFDAAREANRRRLSAQSTLRVRQHDLDGLRVHLQSFQDLPQRVQRVAELGRLARSAEALQGETSTLTRLLDAARTAETVLADHVVRTVPSMDGVNAAQLRLHTCQQLTTTITQAQQNAVTCQASLLHWQQREREEHAALHAALVNAGTCPTCGRPVEG